jgi:hypothetical protein
MKATWVIFLATAALLLNLSLPGFVPNTWSAQGSTALTPNIIKYTPALKVKDLTGIPDTSFVEFSPGRRISVGALRKLEIKQQQMRAPKVSRLPAALRIKPSPAGGRRLHSASELPSILKLPDRETIILPSGRRATVAQIKFLQPFVEKQTGISFAALPKRPNLLGTAVKVNARSDWKAILQMPDSTILESPSGRRITVAEAKQYLVQHPNALPANKTPPGTLGAPQNSRKGGGR